MISKEKFANYLKLASIISVTFEKGPRTSKNNYRPVSILPAFSKNFEKFLQKQLLVFCKDILPNLLCGFRKHYGTQSCLLMMLEFWKDVTDKSKAFGALLTHKSKAFDYLCRDLLIAKLHAYGLFIKP